MKTFVLTHPQIIGEIELRYDERDVVYSMLFRAELQEKTAEWIVRYLPFTPADLEGFKPHGFEVTEITADISFEEFWNAYGKKVNADRVKYRWGRMSAAERIKAYNGLARYFRYLERNTWRDKVAADVYLKDKYWKNEWK